MGKIKMLVMDVDGTLTDGKIYMGSNGEVFKAFDIKDGLGIHELLPQNGIIPVILTGRTSKFVEHRAKELDVNFVFQGIKNKSDKLTELIRQLNVKYENVAYIGDDLADFECMKLCGTTGCPADAVRRIKDQADCITTAPGGQGAVREFIEWLIGNECGEGGSCS